MAITKKPVAAPAPVATKAAPSTKAAPVKAAPAPAAPAPVAATPVTETEVVAETTSSLSKLEKQFASLLTLVKEITSELKVVKKENEKMKKIVEKTERKRANARTSPSGFAKPTKISDEMCDFLGVARGTEMSRTDVTRRINAYVKQHNLNKPDNKRIILPDAKLKKILGVTGNEEVSFFVLQRFIKGHFLKA